MRIAYYSHAGNETGYGRAARDWLEALERIDAVDIWDVPLSAAGMSFDTSIEGAADVEIHHGTPSQLVLLAGGLDRTRARKFVAVTTWETSIFPASYAVALNQYDAVIVPSSFCHEAIRNSCVAIQTSRRPVPIRIVPHCFEPGDWPATSRPSGDDVFTFYSIGAWGERKNVLGVLRAYLHAFEKSDRTRLVLVCDGVDIDVVKSVIARSALAPQDLPGLYIPDRQLTDDEIVQLHQDSDCYVSATRGEGWGLGMFEAAVMQRTVIAPGYGGQRDFLDIGLAEQWQEIGYQLTPVFAGEGETEQEGGGVKARLKLPRGANARQLWAEPDLHQLSRRMQRVRNCYIKRGRDYSSFEENRQALEDRFSTTVVGQTFYRVLEEIANGEESDRRASG